MLSCSFFFASLPSQFHLNLKWWARVIMRPWQPRQSPLQRLFYQIMPQSQPVLAKERRMAFLSWRRSLWMSCIKFHVSIVYCCLSKNQWLKINVPIGRKRIPLNLSVHLIFYYWNSSIPKVKWNILGNGIFFLRI